MALNLGLKSIKSVSWVCVLCEQASPLMAGLCLQRWLEEPGELPWPGTLYCRGGELFLSSSWSWFMGAHQSQLGWNLCSHAQGSQQGSDHPAGPAAEEPVLTVA